MIPITCNAVGDILALATLVLDFTRALDESRGSPAKYRALNSELKSLHIVLASVSRVAELTADPLLRDEIVDKVARCGSDVRRALEKVAKFSALGRDATADDVLRVRVKRQWYKLEWRFGFHGSVQSIREDLAAATQRLTVYLVTANASVRFSTVLLEVRADLRERSDGIHDLGVSITNQFDSMTARICVLVMEQFAAAAERDAMLFRSVDSSASALSDLRRHTPPCVPSSGDTLNGLDSSKAAAAALLCVVIFNSRATSQPSDFALLLLAFSILMCSMARSGRTMVSDVKYTRSNSVTLHDAMGRALVLPLELCETPDVSVHCSLTTTGSMCTYRTQDPPPNTRQPFLSVRRSLVY